MLVKELETSVVRAALGAKGNRTESPEQAILRPRYPKTVIGKRGEIVGVARHAPIVLSKKSLSIRHSIAFARSQVRGSAHHCLGYCGVSPERSGAAVTEQQVQNQQKQDDASDPDAAPVSVLPISKSPAEQQQDNQND